MKVTIEAPEIVNAIEKLVGELKKVSTPTVEETKEPATEPKQISLDDDIRPLLGQAVADGKKAKVKELLTAFDVKKASELSADQLESFYNKASTEL
ncbi:hypothetical protein [Shouchella lonarensis]|uniref:rRNA biogenesis protein rrp5 n=1 Tax=Shouchella lonarensis TaxID=1464122 RepID=A0A1G6HSP0_9BACI|nr:hypothetical protein [Shouchella lonarensis]SDB96875.1 hypothetical protein SAMN05421737_104144 [Shouchella lonarensis]